ncbi:phage tail protein [Acidovorax sp. SUPP1855]|uniref:phage tail protein n=1 Tax=Acidovorax sp. SUPP1855 TaxID=431774 RepID=UPI0023DE6093|nr:phage tail protein [Acidovorax sp. SUPP1855]GKS83211.1 phage tail protein [Acidovorax sp. SUPP1855]
MLKPGSLRDHLTRALPELARDPGKLVVMIRAGSTATRATGTLAFEYAYTLQVLVLDYAGHADAVIVPLLMWLQVNQSDLIDHPEKQRKALRFDVEFLSATTVDLAVEIDLTESVIVRPRADVAGGLDVIHIEEPPHPTYRPIPEQWSLWLRDQKLAEWTHDPRP